MKKTKLQNILIVIAALIVIGVAAFFTMDIQSVKQHNKVTPDKEKNGEVTISIMCDTINDNYENLEEKLKDEKYVPSDGVILKEEKYSIKKDDTAFDVLLKAVTENDIQMEYSGSVKNGTQYIKGINYIYEFSCGKLSGWMYRVNDTFPGYGCGQYKLKDGDKIEFLYTCDLGRDVGDDYNYAK